MAAVAQRTAIQSVASKGFVRSETDHERYDYLTSDGKRTRFFTYFSRGSSHHTIGDALQSRMRTSLGLPTRAQVEDLLSCALDRDGYEDALRAAGHSI
jgi:hypothetical protein